MANGETEPELPALIGYGEDEPEEQAVRHAVGPEIRSYWDEQLAKKHRMSALPWTIKDKSLWKRLITQYDDELYEMIDKWMSTAKQPHKFVFFYMNAHDYRKKDYEWS